MPRLGQRKDDDTIATYLRLPRSTRAELESCIGHQDIKTLTDAVVAASRLLAAKVKKEQGRKAK